MSQDIFIRSVAELVTPLSEEQRAALFTVVVASLRLCRMPSVDRCADTLPPPRGELPTLVEGE